MEESPVKEPFLFALHRDHAEALRALGRKIQVRAGTAVFNEGDVSGRVAVILSGRVKVSSFTEDGREVVLAVRGAGDLLGELSAVDGEPHGSTATAMERVDLLIVPSSLFRRFLVDHPAAAILLLEMVSRRLRDADRKRVEFGSLDTVGRLARRLVEMTGSYGRASGSPDARPIRIDLPMSQQELAGWIGASREAVSKALHTLRARGWIETGRLQITVLDLDALKRRAT